MYEKKFSLIVCLFAIVLPVLSQVSLFPTPARIKDGKGVFVVGKDIKIYGYDSCSKKIVSSFKETLSGFSSESVSSGIVCLEMDENFRMPDEGYSITVTPDNVKLMASSETGLFYAKEAFVQLVCIGNGAIASCRIDDAPRYDIAGGDLCWTKADISLERRS